MCLGPSSARILSSIKNGSTNSAVSSELVLTLQCRGHMPLLALDPFYNTTHGTKRRESPRIGNKFTPPPPRQTDTRTHTYTHTYTNTHHPLLGRKWIGVNDWNSDANNRDGLIWSSVKRQHFCWSFGFSFNFLKKMLDFETFHLEVQDHTYLCCKTALFTTRK